MIAGPIFFDQSAKNDLGTYDNREIVTGQGGEYRTSCLLEYHYFKN